MGQAERLITAITNSLITKSTQGGTQKLVVTDNRVVGTAQACKSCLIHVPASNGGLMYLTTADEAADDQDFLIPKGQVIPYPVDNVSDLHFFCTVNGDVTHVAWRN